jgi:NADPH-dependent 2,4-dienoyl-CoA reductase/sulfur reductase-like enzyme
MSAIQNPHRALLIIGAGPAGISAALAAANAGWQITVVDDNPAPGGQIWRSGPGAAPSAPAQRLRAALATCPNVRMVCGTRVVASQGGNALLLEDAQQAWIQTFDALILCTGARELMLPFPGWILPGVTGAGALQALIKGGLPVRGQRIVLAGSGPLLLAAAASARSAGAHVLCAAEQASAAQIAAFAAGLWRWPGKAFQALGLLTAQYRSATHVTTAHGAGRLESVQLRHEDRVETVACDRLAVGFGLVPNAEPGRLLGCATAQDHDGKTMLAVDARQATSLPGVFAAGECTGAGGVELSLAEGRIAGLAATGQNVPQQALAERARWAAFARRLAQHFSLSPALKTLAQADTIFCRCEDVAYAAVAACSGWTEAKLATRCGMGACQGRICGTAAQHLWGWQTPSPRPPLSPARVGTLSRMAQDPPHP